MPETGRVEQIKLLSINISVVFYITPPIGIPSGVVNIHFTVFMISPYNPANIGIFFAHSVIDKQSNGLNKCS